MKQTMFERSAFKLTSRFLQPAPKKGMVIVMCGIIGFAGRRDCAQLLLSGLCALEYRGYDSAGIAVQSQGDLQVRKSTGRLKNLQDIVSRAPVSGSVCLLYTSNPYLAFALLLHAGLDGIEEKRVLCEPKNLNLYEASPRELAGISTLPANLGEALAEAKESAFVKRILPQKVFHQYIGQKEREFAEYVAAPDKREFERERYFERI